MHIFHMSVIVHLHPKENLAAHSHKHDMYTIVYYCALKYSMFVG